MQQVLQFKNFTTTAELSKLTGIKQLDVIVILNKNEHLIKMDKKTGKILGFHDYHSIQKSRAFSEGRTYKSHLINYGAASELQTHSKIESLKDMKENYVCGGFGDSYTVNVILDTPTNRKKMKQLGITFEDDYATKSIDYFWKE